MSLPQWSASRREVLASFLMIFLGCAVAPPMPDPPHNHPASPHAAIGSVTERSDTLTLRPIASRLGAEGKIPSSRPSRELTGPESRPATDSRSPREGKSP